MTSPTMQPGGRLPLERLSLEFPRGLAVYDTYEDAQRAVDYLSDHEFPVQNVMIVGTDLKQIERVTGRLTWGKVIAGGLLSGMWLGLFVGLIMSLFGEPGDTLSFLSALLVGAVFGIVWAALGYSLTRGRRDFTSVSQVVATRYEVLVEHALFDRGRDLLAQLPGAGSAAMPQRPSAPSDPARPNPYEGRYGVRVDQPQGGQGAPASPGQYGQPGQYAAPQPPAPNPYEGRYGVQTQPPAGPDATHGSGATAAPRPDAQSPSQGSYRPDSEQASWDERRDDSRVSGQAPQQRDEEWPPPPAPRD